MSDPRGDAASAAVVREPSADGDSTWASAVRGSTALSDGPGAWTGPAVPVSTPSSAPVRNLPDGSDRTPGQAPGRTSPPAPPAPAASLTAQPTARRASTRTSPPAPAPKPARERVPRRTARARKRAERRARKEAEVIARFASIAAKRRHRILPRTVIGISLLLLAFGLGGAASGVALFMYYQDKTDSSIAATRDFSSRVDQSIAAIQAEGTNARAQVQNELEPLRRLAATGETLGNVMTAAGPSVWEVRTFGVDGGPVIASAFVVAADTDKSFLISSYSALRAATSRPGPAVTIRKADRTLTAQLWTWDEPSDLALLIVEEGGLPRLDWAAPDSVRLGDQLFALSGLGSKGAAVTQGFVADVSSSGLQHTAPIGSTFEGGPLLTADAKVVAMASLRYAPFGARSTGAVSMAPPIRAACNKVLRCPNGQVTAAGEQR